MARKQIKVPKILCAEAFCLVDSKGKTKAIINTVLDDPCIKLFDIKGNVGISISVYKDSSAIVIGSEEKPVAGITCNPTRGLHAGIWVKDMNGNMAFVAEADLLTNTRKLQLFNKEGVRVVNFEV